jgi:hypothetical protein
MVLGFSFNHASETYPLEGRWLLENSEVDQSYFIAEVDNITKKNFDKQLANIALCAASELAYKDHDNFLWSMKLHPKDGFIWRKEIVNEEDILRTKASAYSKAPVWGGPEIGVSPTGWDDNDN